MFAIYKMELFQIFNASQPGLFQFREVILIVQTFQDLFVAGFRSRIFLFEVMKYITYTDTVTADFIRISRADTFSGSSYFGIPLGSFVSGVEDTVCRKNKMSFLSDVQTFFQRMA